MDLRSEWMPRIITLAKLHELEQAIDAIEQLLSNGKSEAAEESIRVLNETYGRSEDAVLFQNYAGSLSRTELALRLSQPEAVRSEKVMREELIELVRRIQNPDYALAMNGESIIVIDWEMQKSTQAAFLQEFYLERLTANVSMPGISDLIFWDDLEPEEIVDRALAYQPIMLPPI